MTENSNNKLIFMIAAFLLGVAFTSAIGALVISLQNNKDTTHTYTSNDSYSESKAEKEKAEKEKCTEYLKRFYAETTRTMNRRSGHVPDIDEIRRFVGPSDCNIEIKFEPIGGYYDSRKVICCFCNDHNVGVSPFGITSK